MHCAVPQFMAYLIKKQKFTRHQCGNRLFHSTETLSLHVTDHLFNLFKVVDHDKKGLHP